MQFIIKHDSIKFLITQGRYREAKEAVRTVYKHCDEANAHLYVNKIRATCGEGSSDLTLKDAVRNPEFRNATWANVGYIVFHALTGINVILMYSNTIFENMQDKKKKKRFLTPRVGTYLVGAANAVAALIGTQVVGCFGRRALLITGHIAMAIVHFMTGYFDNH